MYIASTSRGRLVGEFGSRGEALDAVGRGPLTSLEPTRVWTALLVTVNVAMIGALSVLGSVLMR
ncbi:hypothetical protein OB08_12315 [Microbacterium sp. HJ5]